MIDGLYLVISNNVDPISSGIGRFRVAEYDGHEDRPWAVVEQEMDEGDFRRMSEETFHDLYTIEGFLTSFQPQLQSTGEACCSNPEYISLGHTSGGSVMMWCTTCGTLDLGHLDGDLLVPGGARGGNRFVPYSATLPVKINVFPSRFVDGYYYVQNLSSLELSIARRETTHGITIWRHLDGPTGALTELQMLSAYRIFNPVGLSGF